MSDRERAEIALRRHMESVPHGWQARPRAELVDAVASALGITFDAEGNMEGERYRVTIDDYPGALRWAIYRDGELVDRIYGGRLPQEVGPGTYLLIRKADD